MPPRPSSRVTLYLPTSKTPTPIFVSGCATAIRGDRARDKSYRLRSLGSTLEVPTPAKSAPSGERSWYLRAVGTVEDETRERLAALGEIAAEIAHELRNVLQVISASAYVARQEATRGDAGSALPPVP